MSLSSEDFDYIRTIVRKGSAIVLEDGKGYLADSRLLNLARREGIGSATELVAQLRTGRCSGLQQKVVEAMTTNETSFFRDLHPFEALRKVVLPDLQRRRATEHRLHIWCAACSTGQEPYSVAMILREHFASVLNWDLRIVATDLSTEVLERARRGCYGQIEVNRGLPASHLVKFFQRQGTEWRLKDEVLSMVAFRTLNLIETWPALPAMDVVFLRNVLIYFDVPTKRAILGKVRQMLRPDGYLFLGGAETTLNLDDAFERLEFERSGCYRLRSAKENQHAHRPT